MKVLIAKLKEGGVPKKADAQSKIAELLRKNPNPEDEQIHALAEELGMEHSQLEEIVYDMLSQALRPKEGEPKKVDPKQLEKGIEVEKEHTDIYELAKKIALDHLNEMPDYYDKLELMEEKE